MKPIASFELEQIPAPPNISSNDSYLTNNDKSDDADDIDEEEASVEVVEEADEQTEKQ